jgi:hypothetical protein
MSNKCQSRGLKNNYLFLGLELSALASFLGIWVQLGVLQFFFSEGVSCTNLLSPDELIPAEARYKSCLKILEKASGAPWRGVPAGDIDDTGNRASRKFCRLRLIKINESSGCDAIVIFEWFSTRLAPDPEAGSS